MKNKTSFVIAAALTLSAGSVFAQSSSANLKAANTSTSKIEDLKKPTEKVKDIDDEITDARMRATLGSKSRFSFQSTLSYSGGSMQDPLGSVRPAYRTSVEDEVLADLSGQIGANFRVTERDNISFGTGITIMDPLHGDITKPAIDKTKYGNDETTSRYKIATPYVGYSRGYKAFGAQMISSVTLSYYTAEATVKKGYLGGVSASQTILANLGSSKWNGGTSISGSKALYSGNIENKAFQQRLAAGTAFRDEWTVGLFPFLQYKFNDTYSFRTVFGYFQFQQQEGKSSFEQIEPYQSAGLGLSITRDIYLYPNVQFTPKDIRADRTNVALTANINLF